MTIKLNKNMKLMIKNKVAIKDDDWSMPGGGYLDAGTIVVVDGSPTHISDVRFKVISGSGEITHRLPTKDITRDIKPGNNGFFFSQGHETFAPYDWGVLDTNYFEVIND